MPERNNEVVIDGYVFPDTVTVTLANDEYINSRDYVSKELYESVCGANDVWQAENAKLRELIVRCCDCESAREHYEGMDVWWCGFLAMYVGSSGFCCWGKKREDA